MYIDVFPLDIHDDKKMTKTLSLRKRIIGLRESYAFNAKQLSAKLRLIRPISKLFYPTLYHALLDREKIYKAIPVGDKIANYSGMWREKEIVPAWWYGEGTVLEFEGIPVTAPKEYDKWLTQVYGNYIQLPPIEKQVSHHDTDVIDAGKPYTVYV